MNAPGENLEPLVPAEGEALQISGVEQWTDDKRTLTALKRLAEAKAPQTIAQMVIWYVTAGAGWDDIGRLSAGWGNASEIALARRFVSSLGQDDDPSNGRPDPRPIRVCSTGRSRRRGKEQRRAGRRRSERSGASTRCSA